MTTQTPESVRGWNGVMWTHACVRVIREIENVLDFRTSALCRD